MSFLQGLAKGSETRLPRHGRSGRSRHLGRGSLLRTAVLLAAGVLVLHHLSYYLRFDQHEEHAVAAAHKYLSFLTPLVALLVTFCVAHFGRALRRARRTGGSDASPPSFLRAWLFASTALCAVHLAQEGLEGYLADGHPGLGGVLAEGWVVLALAVLIGAAIALLVCGARLALAVVARRLAPLRRPGRGRLARPPWQDFTRTDPVACHMAGRGPPLAAR